MSDHTCMNSWGFKKLQIPGSSSPTRFRFLKLSSTDWRRMNKERVYFEITAAAAATKSLQSCLTLCDPIDGSPPSSPSLGFCRQEHWSGLPFPSPMMKVKSQSEVAQLCPTLSDLMDCSLPGFSIHGIFQARALEWVAIAFSVRSLQVALIPCPDDHIQKNYREETVGQETVLKLSFHL